MLCAKSAKCYFFSSIHGAACPMFKCSYLKNLIENLTDLNLIFTKNYVVHFSLMMGWFLATHQSSAVVPLLGFCIACTISELSLCDLCATDSAIS